MLRRAQYLGNDFVGTADEHAGTDFDVLPQNVPVVVERGLPHRRTRKLHGLQLRQRGKLSRPAHLPDHPDDLRRHLFRLKLVRHRPARKFVRISHRLAHGRVVDLDYRAVRQHVQRFAADLDFVDRRQNFLLRAADTEIRKHLKALFYEKIVRLLLRERLAVGQVVDIVKINVGPALRRHPRVEVAYRARRGVARVFQRLRRGFVVLFQNGKADHRLAAHLQRAFIGNAHGIGFYRQHLRRHVLPHHAVAARRRAQKFAVFIGEAYGQPVEFIFRRIFRPPARNLGHAGEKGLQLLTRHRFVEAV